MMSDITGTRDFFVTGDGGMINLNHIIYIEVRPDLFEGTIRVYTVSPMVTPVLTEPDASALLRVVRERSVLS